MPGIVALYESSNCLIVIEEWIEGETVAELLSERCMGKEEAVKIVKDVCAVLAKLHAASIVHRDVKPSNIIVSPKGVYLLE